MCAHLIQMEDRLGETICSTRADACSTKEKMTSLERKVDSMAASITQILARLDDSPLLCGTSQTPGVPLHANPDAGTSAATSAAPTEKEKDLRSTESKVSAALDAT